MEMRRAKRVTSPKEGDWRKFSTVFELKGDRIDRLAKRFESVSKELVEEIEKFLGYLQGEL